MSNSRRLDEAEVQRRLEQRYGTRIEIHGNYTNLRQHARFYCHKCGEFFLQKVGSLIEKSKGHATKCKCKQFASSTKHQCLPEWEVSDLDKPTRKPRVTRHRGKF